jgi:hypothetical protein
VAKYSFKKRSIILNTEKAKYGIKMMLEEISLGIFVFSPDITTGWED